MTVDELDQLLRDRFDLGRDDFIAALKTLPAHRPWATQLTATEAELLDECRPHRGPYGLRGDRRRRHRPHGPHLQHCLHRRRGRLGPGRQ